MELTLLFVLFQKKGFSFLAEWVTLIRFQSILNANGGGIPSNPVDGREAANNEPDRVWDRARGKGVAVMVVVLPKLVPPTWYNIRPYVDVLRNIKAMFYLRNRTLLFDLLLHIVYTRLWCYLPYQYWGTSKNQTYLKENRNIIALLSISHWYQTCPIG